MVSQPDLDLEPVGVGAAVMLLGAIGVVSAAAVPRAPPLFVASAVVGGTICGWLASPTEDGIDVKLGAFHGLHSIGLGGIVLVAAALIRDYPGPAGADSPAFIVLSPMGIVAFAAVGFVAGGIGGLLRQGHAAVR